MTKLNQFVAVCFKNFFFSFAKRSRLHNILGRIIKRMKQTLKPLGNKRFIQKIKTVIRGAYIIIISSFVKLYYTHFARNNYLGLVALGTRSYYLTPNIPSLGNNHGNVLNNYCSSLIMNICNFLNFFRGGGRIFNAATRNVN